MRKIVLLFFITGYLFAPAHAQEMTDSSSFSRGIGLIRQAKTEGDYSRAASYFIDLTGKTSIPWLSRYYAAFCYIQASYKAGTDKEKDAILDKAQPLIDKAVQERSREPELFVLQAFLCQSRIQVSPQLRGMTYSMKADNYLKKATAIDDGNPRAWSLLGYNTFHTPAAFGGGPQKALPIFQKAQERFLSFKPVTSFMPSWGGPENLQMIAECKKSLK